MGIAASDVGVMTEFPRRAWPAFIMGPYGAICEERLSPKSADDRPYRGAIDYAYHLDSGAFSDVLRRCAITEGATWIQSDVVNVKLRGDGSIRSVICDDGRTVDADLFIDCTGFRCVVANSLGAGFLNISDNLLCDRALVSRRENGRERQRPYTTASAMACGWRWEIDLYTRTGVGYVYSSDFCSDDDAAQELRPYVDGEGDMMTIRMRCGRLERAWHRNCVAIGLAAGFVEPLEATGLYYSEAGVRHLVANWPWSKGDLRTLREAYNRQMASSFDRIMDFTILHYVLSPRRDTEFWVECTDTNRIPESLSRRLDVWKARGPVATDFDGADELFGLPSYLYLLLSKGMVDGRKSAIGGIRERAIARALARREVRAQSALVGRNCGHEEYLHWLREQSP